MWHKFMSAFWLAWVASVRKGRGRELGRETAREGGGRIGVNVNLSLSINRDNKPIKKEQEHDYNGQSSVISMIW